MCMSVKDFKATIKEVWKHGEVASWPYRNVILDKETLQHYYSDFNIAINEAYSDGVQIDVGPSGIVRSFDVLVKAMKYSTKEENRKLVSNTLSLLSKLKGGDILNSSGRNIIYKPEDVVASYRTAGDICSDRVHRIIALLKSYAELMYFRSYEISQEIHGPYTLDSSKLIVWQYRNLRPEKLINSNCLLSSNSVIIELFYNHSVDIKLDLYNHVYQIGDNLKDNLNMGLVLIDHKLATEEDLIELESLLIAKIYQLYVRCKQINDSEYIALYINTLWYKLSLISPYVNSYQVGNVGQATISVQNDTNEVDQKIINLLF